MLIIILSNYQYCPLPLTRCVCKERTVETFVNFLACKHNVLDFGCLHTESTHCFPFLWFSDTFFPNSGLISEGNNQQTVNILSAIIIIKFVFRLILIMLIPYRKTDTNVISNCSVVCLLKESVRPSILYARVNGSKVNSARRDLNQQSTV